MDINPRSLRPNMTSNLTTKRKTTKPNFDIKNSKI